MNDDQNDQSARRPKGWWWLMLGFLAWAALFLFAVFDKAPVQWQNLTP